MNEFPIVCIMGPTASGKTALSLLLAEHYPLEIISVDSAQIYLGMNIGTGKPSQTILDSIPHHLINILDPKESYSVWQFREEALKLIAQIKSRNKIPLFVGGTMLYFKALQQGLSQIPASSAEIRQQVLQMAQDKGWDFLHQYLSNIDHSSAARLSPTDKQRVSRAVEIYEMTGRPLSHWLEKSPVLSSSHDFMNIALVPKETERQILHDRIAIRFNQMIEEGLIEETRHLMARNDLHENLPSIRSVGYRQVWQYLQGILSKEEMCEKGIAATRQLAKRQLTWLRQWPQCSEFDFGDLSKAFDAIKINFDSIKEDTIIDQVF